MLGVAEDSKTFVWCWGRLEKTLKHNFFLVFGKMGKSLKHNLFGVGDDFKTYFFCVWEDGEDFKT